MILSLVAALGATACTLGALALYTQSQVRRAERTFPPVGHALTAPGVRELVAHTLLVPIGRLRGPAALSRAFSPAPVPDAYAVAALALALRPTQFRANAQDLRVLGEGLPALRARYPDLAVPVAVLVGEADALTPPETHAVPFAASVSRATLTVVPGAGHQLAHTQPEALIEAIRASPGPVTRRRARGPALRSRGFGAKVQVSDDPGGPRHEALGGVGQVRAGCEGRVNRNDEPVLGDHLGLPERAAGPEPPLAERVRRLLEGEPYGILCTQGGGQPYGSMVAFAAAPDLTGITFATPISTRKFRLLIECDHVALVVDNRPRSPAEIMDIEAVTLTGRAQRLAPGPEFDRWATRLVGRHAYLEHFVAAASCARFRIDVIRYFHVTRFQEVREWIPPRPG